MKSRTELDKITKGMGRLKRKGKKTNRASKVFAAKALAFRLVIVIFLPLKSGSFCVRNYGVDDNRPLFSILYPSKKLCDYDNSNCTCLCTYMFLT